MIRKFEEFDNELGLIQDIFQDLEDKFQFEISYLDCPANDSNYSKYISIRNIKEESLDTYIKFTEQYQLLSKKAENITGLNLNKDQRFGKNFTNLVGHFDGYNYVKIEGVFKKTNLPRDVYSYFKKIYPLFIGAPNIYLNPFSDHVLKLLNPNPYGWFFISELNIGFLK